MVDLSAVSQDEYKQVAAELFDNMRAEDKEEMELMEYHSIDYVLGSMNNSEILYKAVDDEGHLLAVSGVSYPCDFPDDARCVWLLGTERIKQHKRELVKIGRVVMKEYLNKHHKLFNLISRDNIPALTYIQHLGAKFSQPVSIGRGVFVPFLVEKKE